VVADVPLLHSTCIANDTGLEVSITRIDVFTEVAGLIETPLRTVFSLMIVPAKDPAHDAEMTIP